MLFLMTERGWWRVFVAKESRSAGRFGFLERVCCMRVRKVSD